ncbi:hypothetical protein K1719_002562 [Acacia pycnantha]|nr:hypothetical protein K1719_002562 [Acacia pycnantha]
MGNCLHPAEMKENLDQHTGTTNSAQNKFLKSSLGSNNCCMFCHRSPKANNSSPTSTLFGMSHFSPPLSPSSPVSPIKTGHSATGLSPISRYNEIIKGSEVYNNQGMIMSYRDALTELMSSLKFLMMIIIMGLHHVQLIQIWVGSMTC